MQAKSLKWLDDIRASSAFILGAAEGKRLGDYEADPLLRAAVERHFEIIGEAMSRLARKDPATAARISDYPSIIAFRNLLIHGYDLVDHAEVWKVISQHLPLLRREVEALLREAEGPDDAP